MYYRLSILYGKGLCSPFLKHTKCRMKEVYVFSSIYCQHFELVNSSDEHIFRFPFRSNSATKIFVPFDTSLYRFSTSFHSFSDNLSLKVSFEICKNDISLRLLGYNAITHRNLILYFS